MYCQKCGNGISEGDMFCQKCGWKVEGDKIEEGIGLSGIENEKNQKPEEEIIDSIKTKKNRKKTKILFGVSVGIIVSLIAVFGIFFMPKDTDIEAGDLAKLINNGEADKYYSDNLYVHGYLVRDTREMSTNEKENYYILVSNIENWEESTDSLVFVYEEGLEDNLGTGTELIVQGHLKDNSNDSVNMLIGEDVEIKKIVDPIYTLDFEQLKNTEYIDKQINITGRMIDLLGQGHFLADEELNNSVALKGLTEAEFANYFKNGNYATITGILTKDNTIKVDKISQNEFTKKMSYDYGMSVSECYQSYFSNGEEVTIHGIYLKNSFASVPYAVMDEETGQFITLTTFTESIDLDKYFESEEQCVITGNISEGGTGYILEVIAIG